MHVAVCINQVPDPEMPPKQFKLDEGTGRPLLQRVDRVMGPFDENALEIALQLKDAAGARLTALTLGPASNEQILRRALALHVEPAVHVREDRAVDLDSSGTARVLAAAIRKLGDVDLVLCGRQVGDWDSAQVGQLIATELGLPCVSLARQIEAAGNRSVRIVREIPGGTALVEAATPLVATVTNTPANQLRIPKVKDVMVAHRKPITTWSAADLGVDLSALISAGPRVAVRRLCIPESGTRVEMVEGKDLEQVADQLARRIISLKVL